MVRLWGVALYAAVAFAACAAALPTKQAPNTNFAQDGEIDDAADMEESEPQSWESWVSEPQSWETQTQPWESEPQPWEPEGWEPAAWEPEGWNWRAEPGDLLFSPEDPTKALWPTNRSGAGPWSRPVYPEIIIHWDEVAPLLLELSYERMNRSLLTLTGFFNRYYSTQSGMAASEWVHQMVLDTLLYNPIALSSDVTAVRFEHLWPQSSVIVTIPGQTNDTIVLGAHIDTFLQLDGKKSTKPKMPDEKEVRRPKSLFEDTVLPLEGNVLAGPAPDREDYITWPVRAPHPGADDNASGTAALMEILRVLILHPKIAVETPLNTLEFHFYAAEEAGLRGSFEIFRHYRLGGRSIKAMLNIDTIGWVRPKYRPRIAVLSEGDRTGLSTYLAKCVDAVSTTAANEPTVTPDD